MHRICRLLFQLLLLSSLGSGALAYAGPSLVQCNGIKDLVFVPHQDDDLLFMNPDIKESIDAGGCVRVVYLTASERGEGEDYMLGRERGVRSAYAFMARVSNLWTESAVVFAGKRLASFTLNGNSRVQLVLARLKDPWLGKGWGSLTPLSRAESVPDQTAESLGPYVERYTRAELVALIAEIIADYQPSTIRHMDDTIRIPYADLCWRCVGHDHPDHIASARLVRDAILRQQGSYAEVAYVDYPSQERQVNLTDIETAGKADAFKRYAWDDYRYCDGAAQCQEPSGPAAAWVGRTYYVSRRNAPPVLVESRLNVQLFAVGESNRAANVWNSALGAWTSLGGRTADSIAAFRLGNGKSGVFARDATGLIWATRQADDGRWASWHRLGGTRLIGMPVVAAQGKLAVVGVGNDGVCYWTTFKEATQSWAEWEPLPYLPEVSPQRLTALETKGMLTVLVADRSGQIWLNRVGRLDDSGSAPAVSHPWLRLPLAAAAGGIQARMNKRGLIELYFRDRVSGHMVLAMQALANTALGTWLPAVDLGFTYTGQPAVGLNEEGEVIAAAVDAAGELWLVEDGTAHRLGAGLASAPAILAAKGELYIAARSTLDKQTYKLWKRSHGAWIATVVLDPPPTDGGSSFTFKGQRPAQASTTVIAAAPKSGGNPASLPPAVQTFQSQ